MSTDPYDAKYWRTLIEAQQQFEKDNPDPEKRLGGPFFQATAKISLAGEEQRFRDGDSRALLAALYLCAKFQLSIPSWAAAAYIERHDRITAGIDGSWDAVFGSPFPKGTHLAAYGKRGKKIWAVYAACEDAKGQGVPVGPELFESVGRQLNVGKSLCEELYYEAKQFLARFLPNS